MKLLIIADDFTGAMDTGVQLSKHSIKTTVMADPDTPPTPEPDCPVLVINANIRHAEPGAAYNCVQKLIQSYQNEYEYIYIKTDSVLRGNISAAFAAAADTIKKPLCFVPAFPKLGRTTKDGTAYVNGQLLEESVFRDDPRTPTLESYIPDILQRTHPIKCQCLSQKDFQNFTKCSLNNDMVYIFDCETSEQLSGIGDILASQKLYDFTAGCAGFASTFPKHLAFPKSERKVQKSTGPVLYISGSANAVTLKQLQTASETGYPVISLSEGIFSTLEAYADCPDIRVLSTEPVFSKIVQHTVSMLSENRSVVLATARDKSELHRNTASLSGKINENSLHNYIARYTSYLVKSIIDQTDSTGLLNHMAVFGGDMVAAILRQLSCSQVEAKGEVTDGVPLCRIRYQGQSISLVTKSGGFGQPDTIAVIESYLRGNTPGI